MSFACTATGNLNKQNQLFLLIKKCRSPLEQDGEVLPMGSTADVLSTQNPNFDEDESKEIFEKYDPLLHGGSRKRSDKILSVDFMRKYIYLTKILKPVLTDEATKLITDEYAKLRSEDAMDHNVARVSFTEIGQLTCCF